MEDLGGIERYTKPEILTPQQWADFHRSSSITPERRLWFEVMADAVRAAFGQAKNKCRGLTLSRLRQLDVIVWIAGAQDCRMTFDTACDMAFPQLDREVLRADLLRIIALNYIGPPSLGELIEQAPLASPLPLEGWRDAEYVQPKRTTPTKPLGRPRYRTLPAELQAPPGAPSLSEIKQVCQELFTTYIGNNAPDRMSAKTASIHIARQLGYNWALIARAHHMRHNGHVNYHEHRAMFVMKNFAGMRTRIDEAMARLTRHDN